MLAQSPGPALAAERREWQQALVTLGCQLAAVGPRQHEDWLVDAAAVLQFRTRDPDAPELDENEGTKTRGRERGRFADPTVGVTGPDRGGSDAGGSHCAV